MYINTQIITQKVLKIHDVKVVPGYFSHTNIHQTKIQQIRIYKKEKTTKTKYKSHDQVFLEHLGGTSQPPRKWMPAKFMAPMHALLFEGGEKKGSWAGIHL